MCIQTPQQLIRRRNHFYSKFYSKFARRKPFLCCSTISNCTHSTLLHCTRARRPECIGGVPRCTSRPSAGRSDLSHRSVSPKIIGHLQQKSIIFQGQFSIISAFPMDDFRNYVEEIVDTTLIFPRVGGRLNFSLCRGSTARHRHTRKCTASVAYCDLRPLLTA